MLAVAISALLPLGCKQDRGDPPPEVPAPFPPDIAVVGRPIGVGAVAEAPPEFGQGWDSVASQPRGACVVPGALMSGLGGFGFSGGVSTSEAVERLGLGDPLAPLALLDATQVGAARRLLVDDGHSIDRWRLTEAALDTEQFLGAAQWLVDPTADGFAAQCGDQVVQQRVVGGQTLYGWRLVVGDLRALEDLVREVGDPTSWVGSDLAAAEVRRALARWKGRAVMRVVALQRGGEPAMLSAVLGGGTVSSAWTLDCAADDLGPCGAFLARAIGALEKSGDGTFSSTVRTTPAVLWTGKQPWRSTGGPSLHWTTPAEVTAARASLARELDLQGSVQSRLSVLETGLLDLAPAVAATLPAWRATADANLALVSDALRDCGERLTDWTDPAQVARCAAGGTHAALVARGLDETLTAAAMEAVPAVR